MRVAILTSGRFHVCDLARELAAHGHDVAYWSLTSPWRTARFGLPTRCNRWLMPLLAPVYARFTEGFDTLDLIEAKALLAELGA